MRRGSCAAQNSCLQILGKPTPGITPRRELPVGINKTNSIINQLNVRYPGLFSSQVTSRTWLGIMSIQILSDLHLEVPKAYDLYEITPTAPYLALLGDIGNVVQHKDDFFAFLTQQLKQFRVVLFVLGNHEPFDSDWEATLEALQTFEDGVGENNALGEFVVMNRKAYRIPGTKTMALGCSLFSHVPDEKLGAVEMGINDFYKIDGWNVHAHNGSHKRDLDWLNEEVSNLEKDLDIHSIIILTHWSPSVDSRAVDPRHVGSAIGSGFATDLSGQACCKSAKVKLWAFGHTHYNCDFEVSRGVGAGPLRFLANQRGYYFAQAQGFDDRLCIELIER